MSENTKIEWTDHSWSPWRGCTNVSAGCAHCYAEGLAKRYGPTWGGWGKGSPRIISKSWGDPVKWDRNSHEGVEEGVLLGKDIRHTTVFPSLCDPFDDEVPIEIFSQFLRLTYDTPNLVWLLLTKRPENFFPRLEQAAGWAGKQGEADKGWSDVWQMLFDWIKGTPPLNIRIGTSVENQEWADRRIPGVLEIPAVGRFLSVEPLLGTVDLRLPSRSYGFPKHIRADGSAVGMPQGINWVIIGGESGPGARPCNVGWVRSLVRQCRVAGVACFVKQLGALPVTDNANLDDWPDDTVLSGCGEGFAAAEVKLKHPKGGDPAEWPEDLRVREFPEGLR